MNSSFMPRINLRSFLTSISSMIAAYTATRFYSMSMRVILRTRFLSTPLMILIAPPRSMKILLHEMHLPTTSTMTHHTLSMNHSLIYPSLIKRFLSVNLSLMVIHSRC